MVCQATFQNISMSGWEIIERLLAIVGLIGIVLTVVRFIFALNRLTWNTNVSIQDFPLDYDPESVEKNPIFINLWDENYDEKEFGSVIVFKPIDCIIPKLEIIELDPATGKKKRKGKKTLKNITPNEPVYFTLMRSECIPHYMLKWYSDYGEYGTHYFSENRINGINTVAGSTYRKTVISILRRILELK